MRGLRTDRTAQVIIAGHAFMQNLRRGHYELATDTPRPLRVAAAFTELARRSETRTQQVHHARRPGLCNSAGRTNFIDARTHESNPRAMTCTRHGRRVAAVDGVAPTCCRVVRQSPGAYSSRSRNRLIVALAGLLVAVIGLPAAATAASTAGGGSAIGIGAMRFSHPHVVATSFTTNTLTFTITDSHTAATGIGGDLFISQQGPTPGTFIGDSYDIPFLFENSFSTGAMFISGTPQSSMYSYVFAVPQFANASKATWVVSRIVADDGLDGGHLDADPATLGRFRGQLHRDGEHRQHQAVLPGPNMGIELRHGSAPVPLPRRRPSGRDGLHTGCSRRRVRVLEKAACSSQDQAVKRSARHSRSSARMRKPLGSGCGFLSGGDMRDMSCGVTVTFPADSAPGLWNVTQVIVFDNAGNELVDSQPATTAVTLTNDKTMSASNFTATPNPVNDWSGTVTVQIGMTVIGAVGGVSSIFVENEATPTCLPGTDTPTVNADGSVSVPMLMFQLEPSCQITGIAVVDGAGNVALYGSDYGAPDPGLTITNVPDTTPG